MVATELMFRSRTFALHILCLWFTLLDGGAARMLRLPYQPSLEIAEVLHRKLQSGYFCVAQSGVDTKKLQTALDWACGSGSSLGNVDCSAIQQGGSCYQPNSISNHASYAFDAYYVKQGGASGSCNFQGLATVTQTNPSSGSCVYPSSTSSSSSTNTPPTPPTPSSSSPSSSSSSSSPPTLSPPVLSNSTGSFGSSPTTATGTTSGAIGPASGPGILSFIFLVTAVALSSRLN